MYLRAKVWNVQMTRIANNSNILYPIFYGIYSKSKSSGYKPGNVQGLGANQIAALSTDGVLFPKSIRNMSEISEVSEVSELCPKFEHCFYRNIANF